MVFIGKDQQEERGRRRLMEDEFLEKTTPAQIAPFFPE